jgi:hypothetical protein
MGIPLGHKLKIMKRIKEMRQQEGMSVPQSAQSTRTKASEIDYSEGTSIRPVTNNVYEVLPDPNEVSQASRSTQESVLQNQQEPTMKAEIRKVSFAPGTTDNSQVGMNSMAAGDYDEAQSHAGFLEALNAWRKIGKPEEETPKKPKDGKVDQKDVQQAWKY